MRVKGGPKQKNRRKKVLKQTEGFRGRSKNCFSIAERMLERSWQYGFRDRKRRKRDMRRLWISRITAAVRERGFSYSKFLGALKANNILVNRKMMADLAATDPRAFDFIVRSAGL